MALGRHFGPFLLREMLAVGGMGELYIATHPDDPADAHPVVLKILLQEHQESSDFVGMFRDEARIGMRLAHVNIVGIHEVGSIEETPYIVMEYVHGENVRAVLKTVKALGERLPLELAVRIAIDVALGLDHAHRARDENGQPLRLVHRDLSPDNLMVSYDGDVKILDFGIAKAEGRSTHTQMGVLKGKAQYMSPEQAFGQAVDARSDLFALGVVLFEMLTGARRLKNDEPVAQILEARSWSARRPSEVEPAVPAELDAIVVKAFQPDPSARFQSAEEMAVVLTRLLRGGTLPRSRETLASLLRRLFPDRTPTWMPLPGEDLRRPRVRAQPEPSPRVGSGPAPGSVANLAGEPTVVKARARSSHPLPADADTAKNAPVVQAPRRVLDDPPSGETAPSAQAGPRLDDPPSGETVRSADLLPAWADFRGDTAKARAAPERDDLADTEPRPAVARVSPGEEGGEGRPPREVSGRYAPDAPTAPPRSVMEGPVVRAPADPPLLARAAPPVGETSRPRRPPPPIGRPARRARPGLVLWTLLLALVGLVLGSVVFRNRLPEGLRARIDRRLRWVSGRLGPPVFLPPVAASSPPEGRPTAVFLLDTAGRPGGGGRSASGSTSQELPSSPAPVERMQVEGASSARVRLRSDPPGVEIRLDEAPTGLTTPATLKLPPGTHLLSLEAEGYRRWVWSERLKAGENREVKAELVPAPR